MLQESSRLVLETVAVAGLLAVASMLLVQGRAVDSLVPTLSLLGVAVVRLIPSFNRINGALGNLRHGQSALRDVHRDLVELRGGGFPAADALPFEQDLRVENVTFQYPGADAPSLTDVTVHVQRGTAVGIVGATGSGKTTLIDVILGLLTPAAGAVRVDGRDILGIERGWQRLIGYVPQDTYLADTSLRRNIAFGVPDNQIDEQALASALRLAQLEDFVATLSSGLETLVGERGVRLSGGQRQRVGIARALYHNPPVLIMDEATSSLDNETERFVMAAIERFRAERTLIIIAHRLTTVEACDELFFLRNGRVAARGTYRDLLSSSEDFRRMLAQP